MVVGIARLRGGGHERAEAWWEASGKMLTAFADDVRTDVRIDANGRLGSSTSKHVGSLAADQETPDGEWLRQFSLWERTCVL